MKNAKEISLTEIFVQDKKSKGYTAFFAQFPNIIAEGDTEDEAEKNLLQTIKVVFDYNKNQELEQAKVNGITDVRTRSLKFEVQ